MTAFEPTPLERFLLAFWALYAVLVHADVAAEVARVRDRRLGEGVGPPLGRPPGGHPPARETPPPPAVATVLAPPEPRPAPIRPPEERHSPLPGPMPPGPPPPAATPVGPTPYAARAEGSTAVELLALLQREGRLLDFVEEDLGGASDRAVGAAAREVHAGCKRAVGQLFALEPVLQGGEGTEVTVERMEPGAVKLTGDGSAEPPVRGRLRHHGWRVREIRAAPRLAQGGVLQPAEVEAAPTTH